MRALSIIFALLASSLLASASLAPKVTPNLLQHLIATQEAEQVVASLAYATDELVRASVHPATTPDELASARAKVIHSFCEAPAFIGWKDIVRSSSADVSTGLRRTTVVELTSPEAVADHHEAEAKQLFGALHHHMLQPGIVKVSEDLHSAHYSGLFELTTARSSFVACSFHGKGEHDLLRRADGSWCISSFLAETEPLCFAATVVIP
jgi:hypothetical protein